LQGAHSPFDTLFDFYAILAQRWEIVIANSSMHKKSYVDLVQHVSILAQSAIASKQSGASAAIVGFYERIADCTSESISSGKAYVPLCLPPPVLLYTLVMSSSLSILSRICAVLVTYKQALEKQMKSAAVYHTDSTKTINGYLMDCCNLLWRSRALTYSDANSMGCLCPDDVSLELQSYLSTLNRDYAVAKSFDFSHSSLTSSLARAALDAFEAEAETEVGETLPRHAGPVTQQSLVLIRNEGGITMSWKEYRLGVLTWLEARGIDGIKKLMFATMKDLMT